MTYAWDDVNPVTAASELAAMLTAWRAENADRYAAMRARHNRWQAAVGTMRGMREWLDERRAE
jgi:hypothetical protein